VPKRLSIRRLQGAIEFEYRVPEGPGEMREMARCVEFRREALA
jgi:hypothetical protein